MVISEYNLVGMILSLIVTLILLILISMSNYILGDTLKRINIILIQSYRSFKLRKTLNRSIQNKSFLWYKLQLKWYFKCLHV